MPFFINKTIVILKPTDLYFSWTVLW